MVAFALVSRWERVKDSASSWSRRRVRRSFSASSRAMRSDWSPMVSCCSLASVSLRISCIRSRVISFSMRCSLMARLSFSSPVALASSWAVRSASMVARS